tara:strand:- start:502 stop:612 length:111 start_codon:yes stop_codon:yes gene_type:complete
MDLVHAAIVVEKALRGPGLQVIDGGLDPEDCEPNPT